MERRGGLDGRMLPDSTTQRTDVTHVAGVKQSLRHEPMHEGLAHAGGSVHGDDQRLVGDLQTECNLL